MNIKNTVNFSFTKDTVIIKELKDCKILASIASPVIPHCAYLYTDKSELIQVDFSNQTYTLIFSLPVEKFPLYAEFTLHTSHDAKYIAITCRNFSHNDNPAMNHGTVINTQSRKDVMQLHAGDYHTEQTLFPVCFIQHNKRDLVIHATDWNRLDITDLATGELLTDRDFDKSPDFSELENSTFVEWLGLLIPSPSQKRLASIGWVWHPFGCAYTIDLTGWLAGKTWASDGCESIRSYAGWEYYWDSPLFWVNDDTLCIWGAESQNSRDIPGDSVTIYDADSEEALFSFNGPTDNIFFFDRYLFSGIRKNEEEYYKGISIWNIENGEKLFEKEGIGADLYLPLSQELIEFDGNGQVTITQWHDQ